MSKVEVKFSAHSEKYGAKPGDTKSVPAEEVPALVNDGVAAPVTQSEAKKAGVQ